MSVLSSVSHASDASTFSIGALVAIGAAAVAILGAVVAVVRYWLAHRSIRLDVSIRMDGYAVFLAVTNRRQAAQFLGEIAGARGFEDQPAWPWPLDWRHSTSPSQLIPKRGTALLHVVVVQWTGIAQGDARADFFTVGLANPTGVLTRTFPAPSAEQPFEFDIQLSAQGHGGALPYTVALSLDSAKQPQAQLLPAQGASS